jgi:shikimate kinase
VTDPEGSIVLIGAPGAGKTRTGKRVARLLGDRFTDTDRLIVERHGPIAAIFSEYGEQYFRRVERETVTEALALGGVVTLGAGAVLDPGTQSDLAHHRVVQLTVSAEAVEARISDGKRPLLAGGISAWAALVAARQPIYDRLAAHTIDTSGRRLDDVAAEIVALLRKGSP